MNQTSSTGITLGQYNIKLSTPEEIVNSRVNLSSAFNQICGDMQYGPNGVMYVSRLNSFFISAIEYPDNYGTSCKFIDTALYFDGLDHYPLSGFPQFIQSDLLPVAFTYSNACVNNPILFYTEFPNCIDSVKWWFNDPLQAPYDTSTLFNPEFQFSQAGSYEVQHISYKGSIVDTLYQKIYIEETPLEFEIEGGGVYCQGGSPNEITLSNSEIGVSYILFKDGIITETTFDGTGAELNFGEIAETGEYRIKAKRHASSCESWMDGFVSVSVSLPPSANSIKHH